MKSPEEVLLQKMKKHFIHDELVENWLNTKHSFFRDKTPNELIREGRVDELLEFVVDLGY